MGPLFNFYFPSIFKFLKNSTLPHTAMSHDCHLQAPTLQCTSSEEQSTPSTTDSPFFSRTNSAQSLPTPSTNSLYERTLHSLANDVAVQREVALGKRIGFYRLGKELGCGNFSKVKLGVHVLTKEKVAVKVMEKTKVSRLLGGCGTTHKEFPDGHEGPAAADPRDR